MARRGSQRSRRQRAEAAGGWLRIVGYGAIFVALIGAYLYYASAQRGLDDTTLCPETPDSLTVLLVDVTDPMTRAQRKDFLNQLERLSQQIPRHGRLFVARVEATSDESVVPVIDRCNPGTSADVNAATGDPAKIQALHDRQFKAPLAEAFQKLATERPSDRSPIFEAIQSVALSELQKPAMDGKPRRLIVASDLLQHTPPDLNFYAAPPDTDRLIASAVFQTVRTDLSGISAELWMLQRRDTAETQPRLLADTWTEILAEQGANVVRVYRVSG